MPKILCLAFNSAIASEWRQRILSNRWPTHAPTEEQAEILHWVNEIINADDFKRALQLHACAGSGKTDTLFRIIRLIADLKGRDYLPTVEEKFDRQGKPYQISDAIMTAHALGRKVWLAKGLKLDPAFGTSNWILSDIAKEMSLFKRANANGEKPIGPAVISLVEKARLAGIVPDDKGSPLMEDTDENWADVADRFSIIATAEIITAARGVLTKSIELAKTAKLHEFKGKGKTYSRTTIRIDQGGMLYLPVVFPGGTTWWEFQPDVLLTDEMQDFSPLMQRKVELLRKKSGTLLIGAGDPRQAIYGFAGADSVAFANMREKFEMEVKELTISFRCPRAVIAEAQKIEPKIKAAPWAEEGKVGRFLNGEINWSDGTREAFPTNLPITSLPSTILCRNNAPIAALAVHCLTAENPRPVAILGRSEMIPLLKALHSEGLGREGEETRLSVYQANLLSHCESVAVKRPAQAKAVGDRAGVLLTITQRIRQTRGENAPASLILDWLDRLYPEDETLPPNGILFSTIHKSKGLEWRNVGILDPGLIGQWAESELEQEAESNLLYVGNTRSAGSLLFFNSEDVEGMPEKKEC